MNLTLKFNKKVTITDAGATRTIMYVDVKDIPEDIPMTCNPRLQNMNSPVVKNMEHTLLEDGGIFHLLNRGITIIAKSVSFIDNDKAIITIDDTETQGCIDGGHTYKCILRNKHLVRKGFQQVTVEILTGKVIDNIFIKLARARNSSQQVKGKSIAELEGYFDWIKSAVSGENLEISYKENAQGVSIEFIVWLMTSANKRFGERAYHIGAGTSLMESYMKYSEEGGLSTEKNPYYACKDILIDLLHIYDYIEVHFADKVKYFSRICASKVKSGAFESTIYGNKMKYKLPRQFVYPVFSMMSTIMDIDEKTGLLFWVTDPYQFIQRALPELAKNQVDVFKKDKFLEKCRSKDNFKNLRTIAGSIYKDIMLEKLFPQ